MTQSTLATRIHEIKDKLVTTSVPYFSRSDWLLNLHVGSFVSSKYASTVSPIQIDRFIGGDIALRAESGRFRVCAATSLGMIIKDH